MQQIMMQSFFAVKSKLDRRLGFFDLIGCDFMVDEDFKVGHTHTEYLSGVHCSACELTCVCLHVLLIGVAVGDEL